VFFPPVSCDPGSLDASAEASGPVPDAATDAEAGVDGGRCADVTASDVFFTPEACRAFAKAASDNAIDFQASRRAPVIAEPEDGQALTPDEWSIFSWSKGPEARRSPVDLLGEWLEPSAHALTPLSGDGYVIVFTQGCTEILRAMVATTFWTPDPESWKTLTNALGPVTVRVYWLKFAADRIVSGPVASAPITITMTK
jgi:hypothetical protein